MRLSQHQIDIVFAATGIMIIIGYISLFQRPLNGKLKELRSEISVALSENGPPRENMGSKLDQLNQAKARLNQEIQLLETGFFKADRLWDLMQSLTDMAEGAGLTVILVHPQMEPESDRSRASLLIRLSGDFLSFYRFLAMFEKSTPSLKANSLKIEAQPESSFYLEEVQFDLITMPP